MYTERRTAMKIFKKWNNKHIEDWGSVMSDDAKAFYRAFKGYIRRCFPEAELVGFKPNHYDFSGFIKKDGKCIYVSHNIDRYKCCVDFDDMSCMNGVLYRTAKNEKDYHGGHNNFTSINEFESNVKNLFNNEREWN